MATPRFGQNATPTGSFILTVAMLEKMEELLPSYIDTPRSARGAWYDKNWKFVWLIKRPDWNLAQEEPLVTEDGNYHDTKRVHSEYDLCPSQVNLCHRLSRSGSDQTAS